MLKSSAKTRLSRQYGDWGQRQISSFVGTNPWLRVQLPCFLSSQCRIVLFSVKLLADNRRSTVHSSVAEQRCAGRDERSLPRQPYDIHGEYPRFSSQMQGSMHEMNVRTWLVPGWSVGRKARTPGVNHAVSGKMVLIQARSAIYGPLGR